MRLIDTLHGWLLWLYIILIGGAAIAAIAFPILYAALTRGWYKSEWGKFLMFMGTAIGLAMGNSALRIFFTTPAWVSFVLLIMVFIMTWWCLILFLKSYFRARRKKRTTLHSESSVRKG